MMEHDMVEWLNATLERIADAVERIADRLERSDKEAKKAAEASEVLSERIAEAEARRKHQQRCAP